MSVFPKHPMPPSTQPHEVRLDLPDQMGRNVPLFKDLHGCRAGVAIFYPYQPVYQFSTDAFVLVEKPGVSLLLSHFVEYHFLLFAFLIPRPHHERGSRDADSHSNRILDLIDFSIETLRREVSLSRVAS
jgi:hypothetical protein